MALQSLGKHHTNQLWCAWPWGPESCLDAILPHQACKSECEGGMPAASLGPVVTLNQVGLCFFSF